MTIYDFKAVLLLELEAKTATKEKTFIISLEDWESDREQKYELPEFYYIDSDGYAHFKKIIGYNPKTKNFILKDLDGDYKGIDLEIERESIYIEVIQEFLDWLDLS